MNSIYQERLREVFSHSWLFIRPYLSRLFIYTLAN